MEGKKRIRMLTTGMHVFPRIMSDDRAKYVDKTAILHELCTDLNQQLFISRPRRFGKSLMLSTLKAMFECRREYFKHLAIDSLPWEWDKPYPVIDITMASANGSTFEEFKTALAGLVRQLCAQFDCAYDSALTTQQNFEVLIREVARKSERGQVVVLIDEYDEPVAAFLDDIPTLVKVRTELHNFYEKLKINAGCVRFLMITGVTKLTKLSIFSGLNHLRDLTMDPRCATLLGYTPEEMDGTLRENVELFGEKNGIGFEEAKSRLLEWYDGYRFSPQSEAKVCNPVSVGKAFESGLLQNYWEATGRSTMIVNRIRKAGEIPADLDGMVVDPMELDVCDAETMPLPSLLYQGGYLTIRDVDEDGYLTLAMPNKEISKSLHEGFMLNVLGASPERWMEKLILCRREMRAKGVETLVRKNLKAVFAAVPHEWKIESEREAKRYFLLFLKLCGAEISGERQSAMGRADAVLKDKSGVYVFEFKYGKSAAEAVEQARTKDYAGPWLDGKAPVFFVGVNYDPSRRAIDDPLVVNA